MNWKHGTPLAEWMLLNPVTFVCDAGLPEETFEPSPEQLAQVFPSSNGQRLKTWGRTRGKSTDSATEMDPHWLCCTNGLPLHTDPRYPRYTHQLYVLVDDLAIGGVGFHLTPLNRGVYVRLDTHSPHKVVKRSRGATWYVAAAIDSHEPQEFDAMRPLLLEFIRPAPFDPKATSAE